MKPLSETEQEFAESKCELKEVLPHSARVVAEICDQISHCFVRAFEIEGIDTHIQIAPVRILDMIFESRFTSKAEMLQHPDALHVFFRQLSVDFFDFQ